MTGPGWRKGVPSETVITFHSIILGFVTSEYFAGGGEILRQRIRFKPTSLFLLFAIVSFSNLLIFWWSLWNRSSTITDSVFEFTKIIPYSIIYYIIDAKNIMFRFYNRCWRFVTGSIGLRLTSLQIMPRSSLF